MSNAVASTLIYNNVIHGGGGEAITNRGASDTDIRNNIISLNVGAGITVGGQATGVLIDFNLYFGNSAPTSGIATGPNDLEVAPGYVDEPGGDFRILPGSPGANSGIKYNVSEELSTSIPPQYAALGFEYQILDDERHPDAANGPDRTAAALYDLVAPSDEKVLKPVGEFNSSRVVLRRCT